VPYGAITPHPPSFVLESLTIRPIIHVPHTYHKTKIKMGFQKLGVGGSIKIQKSLGVTKLGYLEHVTFWLSAPPGLLVT
jgi:hypothetical protein